MTTRQQIMKCLSKRKRPISAEQIAEKTVTNVETVRRILRGMKWTKARKHVQRCKSNNMHRMPADSAPFTWLYSAHPL